MNTTTETLLQGIIDSKNAIIASLKNKGIEIADTAKLSDLPDIVTNADIGGSSNEKKVVNFYDYDGTLLHSYTREEALKLSELPSLPDRTSEGLTCQGWNYVLNGYIKEDNTAVSGIIDDLNANDENFAIDVGAIYITTDGATHINITFADKYRSKMSLMFTGDITINWGDGVTESVNYESATTITHEYAIAQSYPAKYTIKLTVNNGTLTFGGGSTDYNICGSTSNNASNPASAYSSRIDSVFIGNGVTSIDGSAFYQCYSLASVTIPVGVTSIGQYAFSSCYSLASVTIPSGVSSISGGAFSNCYSLASVTIPNSIESIGSNAFNSCSSLTSVTIPNCVKSISDSAFYYCYSLASATIPNSIESISNYAFQDCRSLTLITIPDSVSSISDSAFQGCSSLASVTISNSIKSISDSAFYYCYSLASVTIPDSVLSISKNAFYYCYSLASVTIPDSVSSIGNNAFYCCYSLTSVTIPDSVTSISDNAFRDCRSLASVTIPDSVSSIGINVFAGCRSLASVMIPNSVTSISNYAFQDCRSLASVTIPDSVSSIGGGAFHSCYGIIKYDFSNHTSNKPPELSHTNAFTGIADDAKIVVPDALYDKWIAATNWATYADYIVKVSEYTE